jgi:hypothetical protein
VFVSLTNSVFFFWWVSHRIALILIILLEYMRIEDDLDYGTETIIPWYNRRGWSSRVLCISLKRRSSLGGYQVISSLSHSQQHKIIMLVVVVSRPKIDP